MPQVLLIFLVLFAQGASDNVSVGEDEEEERRSGILDTASRQEEEDVAQVEAETSAARPKTNKTNQVRNLIDPANPFK